MQKLIILACFFLTVCVFNSDTVEAVNSIDVIESNPVLGRMIVRDRDDKTHSGVIMNEKGLEECLEHYGVKLDKLPAVDWRKSILVFGVTDRFSTRIADLKHDRRPYIDQYYLDYYESGVRYKLGKLPKGMKRSFLEIREIPRGIDIPLLRVKNFLRGLCHRYE